MSNVLPFTRDQRRSTRSARGLGARAKVESMKRLSRRDLDAGRVHLELVDNSGRPLTRGDCVDGPRPCPWVACRHNLFLDVTEDDAIKHNFPDLEPNEVPAEKSCALDVADLGGATLENVADTMNVTRARVRQVEAKAIALLRSRSRIRNTAAKVLGEFSDAPADAVVGTRGTGEGSVFKGRAGGAERENEFAEEEPPTRISFFAESDSKRVDELVTANVWRMFVRWQNGRGFDCRSRQSIAQSKSQAQRRTTHIEEEETMTKEEFAVAHAAFKKAHGRAPTASELFEAIGAAAMSISNVRTAIKRAGLVLHGARGPNAPKTDVVVRKAAPPPATRKPVAVQPKPSRATSADPLVADLISKRDDFRRKADALDTAIEALSVAL